MSESRRELKRARQVAERFARSIEYGTKSEEYWDAMQNVKRLEAELREEEAEKAFEARCGIR